MDVAASREIKALLKRAPAAATLPPPPELEAWFAALQLSEHCARVCGDRLRFVADCSVLDEDDLKASDVTSKVERRRFLAAAAAQR